MISRPGGVFIQSLHGFVAAHWDHEPKRSGVSGERRWKWFRGLAALCRDTATERRFRESNSRPEPQPFNRKLTRPNLLTARRRDAGAPRKDACGHRKSLFWAVLRAMEVK
jgi:hypothetical protein